MTAARPSTPRREAVMALDKIGFMSYRHHKRPFQFSHAPLLFNARTRSPICFSLIPGVAGQLGATLACSKVARAKEAPRQAALWPSSPSTRQGLR